MFKLNTFLRYGLYSSAFMIVPSIYADDRQSPTLVVTASAANVDLNDAPASISVIRGDQLKRKPVQNLKDVLRDIPGVQLTSEGDNRKGVSLRGLGSSYTLILIDGKRINSRHAVFRHNDYDLNWVPVEAIERIEVVRGPMSSLYGSDALGGVINIITRQAGSVWHGSVSADAFVQQHRDRGDGQNGSFFVGGPLLDDLLSVKAWGNLGQRDKDHPQRSSIAKMGWTPRIEGYATRDASVEFSFTPDDKQDISLEYGFDRQDRDSDSLAKTRLERHHYSLGHSGRWGWSRTELRFYGDRIENVIGRGDLLSRNQSLEGKAILPLWDNNQLLTVGGEIRRDHLLDSEKLKDSGKARASQYAFFVEDEWRLLDSLALTGGLRMDKHQTYGDRWSPRAYLVYHLNDNVTLKGGWANAFKAPSLLELSPEWKTPSCRGPCTIVGNKMLKPETSESVELGIYYQGDKDVFDGVAASLTTFQTQLKDRISIARTASLSDAPAYPNFIGVEEGKPVFRYYNVNKARINGIESEMKIPLSATWKLALNYTYTDGRDLGDGHNKPLSTLPRHIANGTLEWMPLVDWAFYFEANYSGERRTLKDNGATPQGYTLWHTGGSWQYNRKLKFRAGVQNLMDHDLSRDAYGFTEEGRRFFAAVDYRF